MGQEFDQSDYSLMPCQTRVDKPWGHEIIYTPADASAVGKILYVKAGQRLSLQYHDQKVETLCLIEGEGIITLMNQEGKTVEVPMELNKGYFVRPGQVHRVAAVTDMTFIESSTPETGSTYRLQDDNNRPTETEEMRKLERS
ncbi:MAG: cupin [Patescibacteria group bacterium]|jgi:mannose-6-phosphate isomerase-like protein (cupin superfamily)